MSTSAGVQGSGCCRTCDRRGCTQRRYKYRAAPRSAAAAAGWFRHTETTTRIDDFVRSQHSQIKSLNLYSTTSKVRCRIRAHKSSLLTDEYDHPHRLVIFTRLRWWRTGFWNSAFGLGGWWWIFERVREGWRGGGREEEGGGQFIFITAAFQK